MRLLKITASNFIARNLRGNRKHRYTVPMAIEEAIDEVKIAWAATACAHRNAPCKMSLGAGGKRGYLFMPDMQPFDLVAFSNDVSQSVQGVAYDPVDPFYACIHQRFDEYLSHLFCHELFSPRFVRFH